MPRHYPIVDRLFALLLSTLVVATGSGLVDTDMDDDDDSDIGASSTDQSGSEPDETGHLLVHRTHSRSSDAEWVWIAGRTHPAGEATVAHGEPWTAYVSVITGGQRTEEVTTSLLKPILQECREHGDLKLVVHTDVSEQAIRNAVEPLGFMFCRSWNVDGRCTAEFYTNIYARPIEPAKA